ncbi:alpha/beta hydrolase [Maribacter sp. 2307ULW6-5]|uniref:alpha/beta hydrolase n=1 Tax=Maribacter sp. 2307ULW6-5 TaxID=3386275 RepID=UPI0039BCB3C8
MKTATHTKTVSYTSTNSYETRGELTEHTQYVWLVFHGIGYLSRYFLRYFDVLCQKEHYIIAPQAPAKYYLKDDYKYVGASWLTKENTSQEIRNNLNYLDQVMQAEAVPKNCKLVVLGFSQGVSMATRWLAHSKRPCHRLLLFAGRVPQELRAQDMQHLETGGTEIYSLVGDQDPFISPALMALEQEHLKSLFGNTVKHLVFAGGHEIKKEMLPSLAES